MKLKPLHFLTLDGEKTSKLWGRGHPTESPCIFLIVSPIRVVPEQTLGKPFRSTLCQ